MKKIRRLLLILAIISPWIAYSNALRATSLIFGRVPNTTTVATTTTKILADTNNTDDESTNAQPEEELVTKVPLTGIPQIDYVWDPNLPQELNGFNLSTYPFLSLVPEADEIDFKCKGLHDGFYASIKFSCQLYHHCIYGIRHDFLCANFTAFDQKTFICQFVSEVDCKSSAKYWFRNDALYRATTTTTTTTTTPAPPPTEPPLRRLAPRRPLRRRRPQIDYYYDDEELEDDYEEDLRSRRRQPVRSRTRRPEYDEYDRGYNYEDERPYKQSYNRGTVKDNDDEYDYKRRTNDSPKNRNRHTESRRNYDDYRNDRRRFENDKRYNTDVRPLKDDRRTSLDDDRRSLSDDRLNERRRYNRPRTPIIDEEDEPPRKKYEDEDRSHRKRIEDDTIDEPIKVRPSGNGASIFNKPRSPPKIARPVPLTEKKKFEYMPQKQVPTAPAEEAYDDYYEDAPQEQNKPLPISNQNQKPVSKGQSFTAREKYLEDEVEPKDKTNSRNVFTSYRRQEHTPVTRSKDIVNEDEIEERTESKYIRPPYRRPTEQSLIERDKDESDDVVDVKERIASKYVRPTYRRPETVYEKQESGIISNREKPNEFIEATSQLEQSGTIITKNFGRLNSREKLRNNRSNNTEKNNASNDRSRTVSGNEDDIDTSKNQQQDSIYLPFKTKFHRLSTSKDNIRNSAIKQQERELPRPIDKQEFDETENYSENKKSVPTMKSNINEQTVAENDDSHEVYPIVRVLKRPFLPSRGGSPYLPRGLKPVGIAATTEPTTIDLEPTTEELLATSPPLTNNNSDYPEELSDISRTTLEPQIESPKKTLETIYNSEYDDALNDALNPTLKPLTLSRGSPVGFSLLSPYEQSGLSLYRQSDITYSPSQLHFTEMHSPVNEQLKNVQLQSYDEYEY